MTVLVVTPRAQRDVEAAIATLGLPADTWDRLSTSLRILKDFPLAGRALGGRWQRTRFVLGPWPWMIVVYTYEETTDRVYIVAVHDARASTTPI